MSTIKNPIIKGFNPDPSIIRVDDMYYIATSTFEWFPGVQIHCSKDLVHWKLLCHPLDTIDKINMIGNPDSGGVFAPCLTYHDGLFYLAYTDTKNLTGRFWDCSNYLITATDINGPWSDPVYLNGTGIDPSLFHDEDGRKWLLNVVLSHKDGGKPGFPKWDGIALQEYDPGKKKLVGKVKIIFTGSPLGITEGPHLYKRNGWYYLLTAEGGTFYNHAITMARSKQIEGPYEIDPQNPILTARYDCNLPLQRTGHGDLVETQNGDWYMVHICGRPLASKGRSVMGRETAIQKVVWTKEGWLRLVSGSNTPEIYVKGPNLKEHPWEEEAQRDDFDSNELNINFQTLRIPLDDTMMSLTERKGYLRLRGHESLSSHHHQSFVARRQQAFCYTAKTCLEFNPKDFQQMAGLVCFYDTTNYIYLYISYEEKKGRVINLMINNLNEFSYPIGDGIIIKERVPIYLKVEVNYDAAYFYYTYDDVEWNLVGDYIEYSRLSDEYFKERKIERFTGTFVGICCQDFTGNHIEADFDFFEYQERDEKEKK